MKHLKHTAMATAVISLLTLAACGGGGGGSSVTNLSGKVADGYLSGAKICVDVNKNGQCDSGEPTAITDSNGAYTLTGVANTDTDKPLLAEVPASAVDSDTPNATVGKSFVLKAPAGSGFVSPLTTLVQQKLDDGTASTVAAAQTAAKAALTSDGGVTMGSNVDLLTDYVAAKASGANAAEYANAHNAARVIAKSLIANYDLVKDGASSSEQIKALQKAAVAQALADLKTNLQDNGNIVTPTASITSNPASLIGAVAQAPADTTTASAATQDVNISFDVVQGATPIRCGDAITLANTALWDKTASDAGTTPTATKLATPGTVGAQSTPGQMNDLRWYVSGLALIDANGNASPVVLTENNNQSKGVALLDFGNNTAATGLTCSDATTHYKTVTGKVKPGTYTGLALVIGVPLYAGDGTKLNHNDKVDGDNNAIASPLKVSAMQWSWQGGRKFMKVEFRPTTAIDKAGTATTAVWNVHLGSTGCTAPSGVTVNTKEAVLSCTNPNRVKLKFDAFNASTQKVVLDVAELFKTSDVTFEGGGAPGCMSGGTDPECATIFPALGLSLANGLMDGTVTQTVFSVKTK